MLHIFISVILCQYGYSGHTDVSMRNRDGYLPSQGNQLKDINDLLVHLSSNLV